MDGWSDAQAQVGFQAAVPELSKALKKIGELELLLRNNQARREEVEERHGVLLRALLQIQQWDCLNPPDPKLCADHPWLKRLVDDALLARAELTRAHIHEKPA